MGKRLVAMTLCAAVVSTVGLARGRPNRSGIATITTLPMLAKTAEALAVDGPGKTIVGYAWDRSGLMHGVKWILQANESWSITSLPWPPGASSTTARAVNNGGDVAGNDFPGQTSHPMLWPASGGFDLLNCPGDLGPATVYAISADAQVVAGVAGSGLNRRPSVWRGNCREDLSRGAGNAYGVSGDGTIVGGTVNAASSYVPARWTFTKGQWQLKQLDSRTGLVLGANATGDLAGYVVVPCQVTDGCARAVIWYASGGSRQLGTLGGNDSWVRGVNTSGEVAGSSTSPLVGNTAFFWSQSLGMVQLPFNGRWAAANGLSDVRPDGTRLVVGMNSQGHPVVWVVRNP